ncbi:hypothetical protein SBY92_002509 [Candida maltosa Xu316]
MLESITFPQFPQYKVFLSLVKNLKQEEISTIKSNLISGNSQYDYCFLNTRYIISREHLLQSIYKSILNDSNGTKIAKTLNSEIIFNLSPVNNIGDALKKFGISEDCPNCIVIKVFKDPTTEGSELSEELAEIIHGDNTELTDDEIFTNLVDIPKFKKLYKLNDAKISETENLQGQLTRLAIGACVLRGC